MLSNIELGKQNSIVSRDLLYFSLQKDGIHKYMHPLQLKLKNFATRISKGKNFKISGMQIFIIICFLVLIFLLDFDTYRA